MAATDYGIDVSVFPDLDPTFTLISGNRVLEEAIIRRLTTSRGTNIDAPNDGMDLRELLNEGMTRDGLFRLKNAIERECLREERIRQATAQLTFNTTIGELRISLALVGADGPFTLTLAVNNLTLTLLQPPR